MRAAGSEGRSQQAVRVRIDHLLTSPHPIEGSSSYTRRYLKKVLRESLQRFL